MKMVLRLLLVLLAQRPLAFSAEVVSTASSVPTGDCVVLRLCRVGNYPYFGDAPFYRPSVLEMRDAFREDCLTWEKIDKARYWDERYVNAPLVLVVDNFSDRVVKLPSFYNHFAWRIELTSWKSKRIIAVVNPESSRLPIQAARDNVVVPPHGRVAVPLGIGDMKYWYKMRASVVLEHKGLTRCSNQIELWDPLLKDFQSQMDIGENPSPSHVVAEYRKQERERLHRNANGNHGTSGTGAGLSLTLLPAGEFPPFVERHDSGKRLFKNLDVLFVKASAILICENKTQEDIEVNGFVDSAWWIKATCYNGDTHRMQLISPCAHQRAFYQPLIKLAPGECIAIIVGLPANGISPDAEHSLYRPELIKSFAVVYENGNETLQSNEIGCDYARIETKGGEDDVEP